MVRRTPPLEMAITSGERSTIAGKITLHKAGASTTLTGTQRRWASAETWALRIGRQQPDCVVHAPGLGENRYGRRRRVKVGRYLTGSVIVSEGLKDGENVVVAGGQLLHPGMKVEVAPLPAQGAQL